MFLNNYSCTALLSLDELKFENCVLEIANEFEPQTQAYKARPSRIERQTIKKKVLK